MISIKHAVSFITILAIFLCVSVSFAADAAKSANPVVVIETTLGNITVELYPDKAPKSVANFLQYVKDGYYNGTIFHRVIKNFMIQGGGYTEDLSKKSGVRAPIANEAANGLKNEVGTIAMARTNEINSATCEFFINTKYLVAEDGQGYLDHRGEAEDTFGYAVFGKVTDGMKVVRQIEKTATGKKSGFSDVPKETITIKSVTLK
jgi:peptidyl-prolyl cis-trans isomerase B (cyclophilin B)